MTYDRNEKEPKTHFVANLKIEKVERQPQAVGERGNVPPRVVEELTHLTIKAEDLDTLTDKLGKHIALIEEN